MKCARWVGPLLVSFAPLAPAKEVINSPSPDGKYVLRVDREKDEAAIVEKKSHKVMCKLETPSGEDGSLVWSTDSQRVAYLRPWRRGTDLSLYFRNGKTFEELTLPENMPKAEVPPHRFRNGEPKNINSWHNLGMVRWLKSGGVELISSAEDELESKASITITVEFDKQHKARIVKSQGTLSHYINSGDSKQLDGDHDAAIAEYSHALELDGKCKDAFIGRGISREAKGDFEGAIADYSKGGADLRLGDLREMRGDHDGAIADYTRHLKDAPQNEAWLGEIYLARGGAYLAKQQWKEALADFRAGLSLKDAAACMDHGHFLVWLARVRAGEKDAANQELAASIAAKAFESSAWSQKIADFLLDHVTEADFIAAAPNADIAMDPEGEAWFYVGIKRELAGNKKGAVEYFKKALEANQKVAQNFRMSPENHLSLAELRAQEAAK